MGIDKEFWERWYSAEELDRLSIIEELPLLHGKSAVKTLVSSTLLNSYFEDLAEYVKGLGDKRANTK